MDVVGGDGRLLAPRGGGPTRGEYTQRFGWRKAPPEPARASPVRLAMLEPMRTIVLVVGLLVALAGAVFALQGAGILPGSYMTGDRLWLVIGLVMVPIGLAMAWWARRSAPRGP